MVNPNTFRAMVIIQLAKNFQGIPVSNFDADRLAEQLMEEFPGKRLSEIDEDEFWGLAWQYEIINETMEDHT